MLPCLLRVSLRAAPAALLLLVLAPTAFAQPLTCGRFINDTDSAELVLEGPDRGYQIDYSGERSDFLVQLQDGQPQVIDLGSGSIEPLKASQRGRALELGWNRFVLRTPAQCSAPVTHADGSCLADPLRCLADRHDKDTAALEAGCSDGMPALCRDLPARYRKDAQARQQRDGDDDAGFSENQLIAMRAYMERAFDEMGLPALCREDSDVFDEAACRNTLASRPELGEKIAEALQGAALAAGMVEVFAPAPDRPLSKMHRMKLQGYCEARPHGWFCTEVAEQQWDAGDLQHATAALALACTAGDSRACAFAPPLQQLGADLTPQAAATLPCGAYVSQRALMDSLRFGDRGLVDMGMGQLRARLEDGAIRIRHEQGGDFVLKPLPNGDLLGMDQWTRFQRFQRTPAEGDPARCVPPVQFTEVPLPQDCPKALVDGGAEACCARGSMQGCNVLGTQLGLKGQWEQASVHYLQVCRAGIREGCENLATAQERNGDVDAHGMLQALCQADASGRHVACDLLDTRNWAMMSAGHALEQALQNSGDDADQDIPPAPRTPNHKR